MALPPDHNYDNPDHEDEKHKELRKRIYDRKLAQCHQAADQAWATFRDKAAILTGVRDRMTSDPGSLTEMDLEVAVAAINLVLGEVSLRKAIVAMGWD